LDSEIHRAEESITPEAVNASSLTLLPVNTLLVAMYGQGQTRGRTGLLKIEATVNQACLAILPNPARALPEYLQLWFVSQYSLLRYISEARNSTQPNLNAEIIKSQKLVMPPLVEQELIIKVVRSDTETVATAIERANLEVELLHEYRTRLIADVVTGKLDVRAVSANLADELKDVDALDETDSPLVDASAETDNPDVLVKEIEGSH
ncbi:MAG: restriction endonuclease subunit S, partial [Acidobacteria bacterium]|nr:restriction endonuclease subunit S [Acidobacteriota bacterium]